MVDVEDGAGIPHELDGCGSYTASEGTAELRNAFTVTGYKYSLFRCSSSSIIQHQKPFHIYSRFYKDLKTTFVQQHHLDSSNNT